MKNMVRIYSRIVFCLLPIFFFPLLTDGFDLAKNFLLMITALIGLVLWIIGLLAERDEKIRVDKNLIWGLLLGVWILISWIKESGGLRMQAIISWGGMGTILALMIWGWIWTQIVDEKEKEKMVSWLTVSGILVAVISLVVFLIPGSKMPILWPKNNPIFSITNNFSLTGSLLAEMSLMVFLGINWGLRVLRSINEKKDYMVEAVLAAFFLMIFGLGLFRQTKVGWNYLDMNSSWSITAESFKKVPLWGAGVGNYLTAFDLWKPASFNMTKNWTTSFGLAATGWMQIWTELGIVGLLVMLVMMWNSFKFKKILSWFLVVGLMLLPLNLVLWWLMVWIMVSMNEKKEANLRISVGDDFNVGPWVVLVMSLILFGFGSWNLGKMILADSYIKSSLIMASKNDGGATYNLQVKAIGMNPYLADYRRLYSQTNLALAKNILSVEKVSDEEKQKASMLIQQAVREAKASLALVNTSSTNWNNLATIYRQVLGLVEGAGDWSLQAYQQAIALKPTDPLLYLDVGGLYFAGNRFEEADRNFEMAVNNKPDLANSWYNWAYSAKKMNKLADAIYRLNQSLSLVSVDSGDYEKASKELDTWKKEYDELVKKAKEQQEQQKKEAETLKTPEVAPTISEENKLVVPTGEIEPPKN